MKTGPGSEHLVVGLGEVGKAIKEALERYDGYNVFAFDKKWGAPNRKFSFIHICFPYNKKFVKLMKILRKYYLRKNGVIIVHSTVLVGTCELAGAVHSPIRGMHPHLKKGILIFTKYFGGPSSGRAAKIFKRLGIKTKVVANSSTSELLKLCDTLQYGVNIRLEKEIFALCKSHGVDFDVVYTDANKTYNKGYIKLSMTHVTRPVLKEISGKIGGRCIIQNANMTNTKIAKELIKFNDSLS